MRNKNAERRRDKMPLEHDCIYFGEDFELKLAKNSGKVANKSAIYIESIKELKPKGREKFLLDLAKGYIRDYQISVNPQFEKIACILLRLAKETELPNIEER